MTNYIVLLRGINVSGKNKLPMKELRYLLNDLKYQNVQTYIQSGNIILESNKTKPLICKLIKEAIKEAILEGEIPNEYEASYNFMLKKAKAIGLTAQTEI